jgi:inorganic phosphate transporter, PiT family
VRPSRYCDHQTQSLTGIMIHWLYISTGLFLGWSLGANHAVNVFGTAVVSRMVRFRTAAVIGGVCVILGAVLSGAGTTRTLNTLGAVNTLPGAFTVALSVGLTVAWMTKLKLPVSTSQAVVGGIIGWNLFTGSPTDTFSLSKILSTWLIGPLLAAVFGFLLFRLFVVFLRRAKLHILHIDAHTRTGLLVIGALASYMLGANNIANVMGMFVSASPFADLTLGGFLRIGGSHQLFFLGGVAIAAGILTYGKRVMQTVGKDLYQITPLAGLVVVVAETLVLILFTSESLESLFVRLGLPPFPLVPLSSTQVVIGAVIGVGIAKGGRGINYRVLGRIASGWITAPLAAGLLVFVLLFFVQNVFEQQVVRSTSYAVNRDVLEEVYGRGVDTTHLASLSGIRFPGSAKFRQNLERQKAWTEQDLFVIFSCAELDSLRVDSLNAAKNLDSAMISREQRRALYDLHGRVFAHRWQLDRTLEERDAAWVVPKSPGSESEAKRLRDLLEVLYGAFRVRGQ